MRVCVHVRVCVCVCVCVCVQMQTASQTHLGPVVIGKLKVVDKLGCYHDFADYIYIYIYNLQNFSNTPWPSSYWKNKSRRQTWLLP